MREKKVRKEKKPTSESPLPSHSRPLSFSLQICLAADGRRLKVLLVGDATWAQGNGTDISIRESHQVEKTFCKKKENISQMSGKCEKKRCTDVVLSADSVMADPNVGLHVTHVAVAVLYLLLFDTARVTALENAAGEQLQPIPVSSSKHADVIVLATCKKLPSLICKRVEVALLLPKQRDAQTAGEEPEDHKGGRMSREEVEHECREQRPSAGEFVNEITVKGRKWMWEQAGTGQERWNKTQIGADQSINSKLRSLLPPCTSDIRRGGEGVVDVGTPSACEKRPSLCQRKTLQQGFEGELNDPPSPDLSAMPP
ncbi:hypothetical protein FB451DRAFT_1188487 [Mycena latifolia]|nr:hypothetical protein FB451DRAFT_1188487 [Mycena latifolia]